MANYQVCLLKSSFAFGFHGRVVYMVQKVDQRTGIGANNLDREC